MSNETLPILLQGNQTMVVATVSLLLHSDFLIFMGNCALAQETISVLRCTMISSSLTGYIKESYFLMQNVWRCHMQRSFRES